MASRRLYRSQTERMISGVCGGLGHYFDIDPTLVRIIFAVLTLVSGGILLIGYVIAWIVIPESAPEEEPIAAAGTGEAVSPKVEKPTRRSSSIGYWPGFLLIGIGLILLLRQLDIWYYVSDYWPVLLIAIGVLILVTYRRGSGNASSNDITADPPSSGGGVS